MVSHWLVTATGVATAYCSIQLHGLQRNDKLFYLSLISKRCFVDDFPNGTKVCRTICVWRSCLHGELRSKCRCEPMVGFIDILFVHEALTSHHTPQHRPYNFSLNCILWFASNHAHTERQERINLIVDSDAHWSHELKFITTLKICVS